MKEQTKKDIAVISKTVTASFSYLEQVFRQIQAMGVFRVEEYLHLRFMGIDLVPELSKQQGVPETVIKERIGEDQIAFLDLEKAIAGLADKWRNKVKNSSSPE